MLTTHIQAKMKETRKTRLITAAVFSLVTTIVAWLFSQVWGQILALVLGLIISFWFMNKTHEFSQDTLVNNKKDQGFSYFFKGLNKPKLAFLSFITYTISVIFVFILLQALQFLAVSPLISLLILVLLFLYLDAFAHIFWFNYDSNERYFNNLLQALRALLAAKSYVLKVGLKYLKPLIQGVLLTFVLVVFFNAIEIQAALQLSEAESTVLIKQIFNKNTSQLLISLGTFFTFYYIYMIGSVYYVNLSLRTTFNK